MSSRGSGPTLFGGAIVSIRTRLWGYGEIKTTWGGTLKTIIGAVCLLAIAGVCHAQTPYTWNQHGDRLAASKAISAGGPDMAGDAVSLSNGALSFSATDVSIPGSNGLPVEFSRSYTVRDQRHRQTDSMLGDWDVEVPNISGIFAPDWVIGLAETKNRCSAQTIPKIPNGFNAGDFWNGATLSLGSAGGELLLPLAGTTQPSTGGPYKWVTGDGKSHVSCITNQNEAGEGFLVITADGTRYWFDWMAQYAEPGLKRTIAFNQTYPAPGIGHLTYEIPRTRTVLYVTRVQDRFGNRVDYAYTNNWNQPGKLTQITGYSNGIADGRQLTINYSSGRISTVTDGSRTWSYGYGNAAGGRKTLTGVTLPVGSCRSRTSQWVIDLASLTSAEILFNESSIGDGVRTCQSPETPQNHTDKFLGSITHPSGEKSTFTVGLQPHGRGDVPVNCDNVTTLTGTPPGSGNETDDDENIYPIGAYTLTLEKKAVEGTGLTPAEWTYVYNPGISVRWVQGATRTYPVCDYNNYDCAHPPCAVGECQSTSNTIVIGPTDWTRYTYGNSYLKNEGKLLKVEIGASETNILKTVTYVYDMTMANQAYPARYGMSIRAGDDGYQSQYHRPLLTKTTTLQSTSFVWQANAFDWFANPLSVLKMSTPALGSSYSKTETYEYENNLSLWVIGQIKKAKQGGITVTEVGYDPVTSVPITYRSFDKLVQTLTYNADGTVATAKDGANNVTTLSSWYRGIPRTIKYPATDESPLGATQVLAVSPQGWVTGVTDENAFTTTFGYDAMGRVNNITYPTGDSTVWNNTTQVFENVAGQWRQTVSTGNARKITYFDALWRPALTWEYDNTTPAIQAATQRYQRFSYDAGGRLQFASYPGSASTTTSGTWNEYDALNRITSVLQNSETTPDNPAGLLTTLTEYQPNFKVRVTSPKLQQTTTTYMAYRGPTTDWPMTINHAGMANTDITRDPFGKPWTVKRRSPDGTLSVTRSYKYDDYQQLCFSIEPETQGHRSGLRCKGQSVMERKRPIIHCLNRLRNRSRGCGQHSQSHLRHSQSHQDAYFP